jgi:tetratricopeptide (TPR) repeat protein
MNSGAGAGHAKDMSPAAYLRTVKALLSKGKRREAYELLQSVVVKHENDPFLLSYFGYLAAVVGGKYRNGIESCTLAITLYKKKMLLNEDNVEEELIAVLYLNLGRAYLAGGKKKDAIASLYKGLQFDRQNSDLLAEVRKLGIRKKIPITFLDRSNPINALFGRMMRKNVKHAAKKGR